MARVLLFGGAAAPLLYFATQATALGAPLFGAFALKGRARQPSELGCCHGPLPWIADIGFILTGAAALLGNAGVFSRLESRVRES